MQPKIIYEDENLLVIDKPAGIIVCPETKVSEKTLIDYLLENHPYLKNVDKAPRYGIVHRLDKDTSGILLIAKNNNALDFFQKQFKTGKVEKKYLALVVGRLKSREGLIETLIGREPKKRKKQRVYLPLEPDSKRKRRAITEYRVLEKFKNYTLVEVRPKTGRKHQIRAHLAYIGYPVAGDKMYGFKNQSCPKGLNRHFLHASYLKIKLPDSKEKPTVHTQEFSSELPKDLKLVLKNLQKP